MTHMNNNHSLTSYLWEICKKYKYYFSSLIMIAVIASLFEISVHYKIKEIIDIIASKQEAGVGLLIILFIAYKFMHHSMFFIVRLLDIKYKPDFRVKLTTDLYLKTTQHSLHWFDSHMSGEISDKINGFTLSASNLVSNIFRSLVVLCAIIVGLVFLFKISYLSALVQLGFLIIYTPILYFLLKKQLYLEGKFTDAEQEVSGVVNDSISNIFGIKIIGNLANEMKLKIIPSLLNKRKWDRKTRKFDAFWIDNTDTILTTVMSASQIYLLAYLYQTDQITAGGFAFVAMIMLKVHGDIEQLLEKILFGINPQIASIKASYKFINEKYDVQDKQNATILNIKRDEPRGQIEFKDVCFSYSKDSPHILDNFSLNIKAGEKIGIVGHSGAGKTTLIKSILRYFDINSGNILIDGNNISDLTQESLRANISIIPQDITMFHRSILDNLKIAKYEATEEEIIESCKKARIHQDILKMSEGYDSIVGERGVKVSGGQRQRIAIARAILKDAPILILDEATSSLDSQTEKHIQKSLNLLIEDTSKTVIAIAHRLSTLKHMDRIIVLDKGKAVEEGSHDELLNNENSLYKKLWELQEI